MASGSENEVQIEGQPDKRTRITLSPDELRVLRECNQESFWYRCVPLGIVFIGSTQMLVNRGFLNPNPRFGALFKNMGAALAAFLIGKMSYQGVCREKILQLENSELAEAIRRGKRGVELMKDMSALQETQGFESQSSGESSNRHNPRTDLRNEGVTVQTKGLDDSLRPSMDRETSLYHRTEEPSVSQPQLSYDELRQRNRVDYERKLHTSKSPQSSLETKQVPTGFSPDASSESSGSTSSWETESGSVRKGVRRNKYGDIIE